MCTYILYHKIGLAQSSMVCDKSSAGFKKSKKMRKKINKNFKKKQNFQKNEFLKWAKKLLTTNLLFNILTKYICRIPMCYTTLESYERVVLNCEIFFFRSTSVSRILMQKWKKIKIGLLFGPSKCDMLEKYLIQNIFIFWRCYLVEECLPQFLVCLTHL